jgi:hypothetical protein
MQVTFKLPSFQATRALYLVSIHANNDILQNDTYWAGDLIGLMDVHPALNQDQFLDYDKSARTVSYKGQRHPLHQDGGLGALHYIATGKTSHRPEIGDWIKTLDVRSYTTSDRKLRWYETLDSYIHTRASQDELVAHFVKNGWTEKSGPAIERFEELNLAIRALLNGKSEAAMAASFDAKSVRQARQLLAKFVK